jgi:hypothetical protein
VDNLIISAQLALLNAQPVLVGYFIENHELIPVEKLRILLNDIQEEQGKRKTYTWGRSNVPYEMLSYFEQLSDFSTGRVSYPQIMGSYPQP